MRDDEFDEWVPRMCASYADDLVRHGGVVPERAQAKAANDLERLFPDGRRLPEHSVFVIEVEGRPVGDLWLAERAGELHNGLWVYDVRIDDGERGRGYGRAAMVFAEEEARRRGLESVGLMVFGGNDVARRLYRALGYVENAVYMSKRV